MPSTPSPPSRAAALGAVVPDLDKEHYEIHPHHRLPDDTEARMEGEDHAARFWGRAAVPITARPSARK
jgi:hypothetical protein